MRRSAGRSRSSRAAAAGRRSALAGTGGTDSRRKGRSLTAKEGGAAGWWPKAGRFSPPTRGAGQAVASGCRSAGSQAVALRPAAKRTDKQSIPLEDRPHGGRTNTKIPSCGAGCTLWAALDGQRVQAVEQPCRQAGGCRRRSVSWTVATALLAARPERRPRVPGGAWSEGLVCAAADSTRPKPKTRSESLACYLA